MNFANQEDLSESFLLSPDKVSNTQNSQILVNSITRSPQVVRFKATARILARSFAPNTQNSQRLANPINSYPQVVRFEGEQVVVVPTQPQNQVPPTL
jgi:hypothetical protein